MWLKKVYDQGVGDGVIHKTAFADERAIADFGVGKNMVSSIRHWALACGVMYEDGEHFRFNSLAAEILCDGGLDPYAESPSTAWLAHWQLAGRCYRSTTWQWLFNHVTAPTFMRASSGLCSEILRAGRNRWSGGASFWRQTAATAET